MRVTDLESFKLKANLRHNNKYDYSKSIYVNNRTKIIIICPIHGEFLQNSNDHLQNNGCVKCGFNKISKDRSLGQEKFLEKANLLHNNFYNYDKVVYNRSWNKVIITCPKHSDFECSPNNHLRNKGCPKCKRSKGELTIVNYLQENNIQFVEQKRFKNCKHIRPLPFDFYLPDYNLLLEYHGEQHFIKKITNTLWKNYDLEHRQMLDKIKKDFAIENFNYLEISYKENINNKLKQHLKIK
jgi:Zn ribbon nucleic-acid-binding protein